MKNTIKTLIAFLVAITLTTAVQAQSIGAPTETTLSAAVSSGTQNTLVTVTSTTGMTASTNSVQTFIMVERELMRIRTVQSSTVLVVVRAIAGDAVGHVSGRRVIYGPGGGTWNTAGSSNGVFLTTGQRPTGSCTRSQNQYLPLFSLTTTPYRTYDCLGGYWVEGTMPNEPDATPILLACTTSSLGEVGNVAYASMGTSATNVAGTTFYSSIMVPKTGWVTGIQVLQGGTATTDSEVFILRDSAFNLIANGSTTGTALSGANTWLSGAFTAARLVVGPARYFIGIQGSGSVTGSIRTIATNTFKNVVTTSTTGTFGVIPATGTAPTTFTADVGPYACLYY